MRHVEDAFAGQGSKRIFWQAWLPNGAARAVVVIAHGASEHGGRYGHVVDRLLPDGHAVYAIDHRGHGRSEGRRAQLDRMASVVADLDVLVRHARDAHPGVPLVLLGHSMGGTVALAYVQHHQDRLDALALSAPLAAVEAAPLPLRAVARVLSAVWPDAGLYDVDSSAVSRDPDEVRRYREDPLVHHGKLPARTLQELADTIAALPAAVPAITVPLLVQYGTEDRLVPPAGCRMVAERAGSADKTVHVYDGYFHELYNEPAGERERPLDDLAAWLETRAR